MSSSSFEEEPLSLFIVPPRAQASRRCETQATLGGKPPSSARFRSLDPFRLLREPDRRRRDEERPSRSEQRTVSKPTAQSADPPLSRGRKSLDRESPIQVM